MKFTQKVTETSPRKISWFIKSGNEVSTEICRPDHE